MPGRALPISLCVVILASITWPDLCAGQRAGEARFGVAVEVQDALTRLVEVSKIAWTFDNLRPTLSRAVWPVGTVFAPPQAPVIHLSPASPVYGELLGEMAFWDSVYGTRSIRVRESVTQEKARLEKDLDVAEAEQRRACARAWSYNNLRSLVRGGGSEPATILNPFLPVPVVYLSPASPTAVEIIGALRSSEAKIKVLKEALEKPGGNALQLPPPDLAMLFQAWRVATMRLSQLASAARDIQRQVDDIDRGRGAFATPLYGDLAGARVRVIHAQWEVATIKTQIDALQQQGALLPAGQGNAPANERGNVPAPPNPRGPAARGLADLRAELRLWTLKNGRRIDKAQYMRGGQSFVVLRSANGRMIKVRLDLLSEDDQTWIRETRAAASAHGRKPAPGAGTDAKPDAIPDAK